MRFVATERAGDGARLAMDVYGGLNGTVPLLRVGVALSSRYRQALLDAGIRRILVADDESAGITVTTQLSEETRKRATSLLRPLLERSQRQIAQGERVSRETVKSAAAVAAVVSGEVLEMSDGVVTFADGFGPGGYSLQHPIDVTVLGLLIARRLFAEHGRIAAGGVRTTDGTNDSLRRLSLGLLLHDVCATDGQDGMHLVAGALCEDDVEVLSAHTQKVNTALPWSFVSAHAAAAVRCHHEHWDGSGPQGLVGEQIPQFARIAAVADTYDALTSSRSDCSSEPAHRAVAAITQASGTLFDPQVVDVFRAIVAPFPPGTGVTLSDGSAGVVTEVPADALHRPVVRLLSDRAGTRLNPVEISVGSAQAGVTIAAAA